MQALFSKITQSFQKIKQLHVLTVNAMLVALYVLSSVFLDFYPSDSIKISFGFLFIAIAAYLNGPVSAMFVGALGDFVAWLIYPHGMLNVGITLSMAVMGLIFGLSYYNEKPSLLRCIITAVTETALVELLLKTWALKTVYGTSFGATLLLRLLPAGIMLAVTVLLTFGILKAITPIKARLDRSERARRQ